MERSVSFRANSTSRSPGRVHPEHSRPFEQTIVEESLLDPLGKSEYPRGEAARGSCEQGHMGNLGLCDLGKVLASGYIEIMEVSKPKTSPA